MIATCCICSDILDEVNPISSAPCGHVFHLNCLMSWVEKSHTCPVCRRQVNTKNALTLYFNFATTPAENASILENEILNLKGELTAKNIQLENYEKLNEKFLIHMQEMGKNAADLLKLGRQQESEMEKMRLIVKNLRETKDLKLEEINADFAKAFQCLNNIPSILNGAQEDAEITHVRCGNLSETSQKMTTYCAVLKRELQNIMDSKNMLLQLNLILHQENCHLNAKVKFYEEALALWGDDEAAVCTSNSVEEQKAAAHNLKLDSRCLPSTSNGINSKS